MCETSDNELVRSNGFHPPYCIVLTSPLQNCIITHPSRLLQSSNFHGIDFQSWYMAISCFRFTMTATSAVSPSIAHTMWSTVIWLFLPILWILMLPHGLLHCLEALSSADPNSHPSHPETTGHPREHYANVPITPGMTFCISLLCSLLLSPLFIHPQKGR
jgi:hypothetical protein